MNDQELINSVWARLKELHKQYKGNDENASLALQFKNSFRKVLFKKLETGKTVVTVTTNDIFQEPCKYDIRIGLDDETINDIASMGYCYITRKSNQHYLFFEKANLQ